MPDSGIPDLPDTLARICAATRAETERRREALPVAALQAKIRARRDRPRGFAAGLGAAVAEGRCGLIAEMKRASPSGGLIRAEFDPSAIARAYAEGGAACLSVLTDGPFFQGSNDDLKDARAACALPVLRKDFILDPWQVFESRAIGADCILLIMAALTDAEARELEEIARGLRMDVLAEVHDRRELDRALGLQTTLIGINNRDLRSLRTDLAVTRSLAPHVPPDRLVVAESGIATHAELRSLAQCGAHCFLVGESLLRRPDLAAATRELLGGTP